MDNNNSINNCPEEQYENNDICIKSSLDDSNSVISEENNYRNDETIYEKECIYKSNNINNYYNFNKKPKTLIDFLNINSDEYKKNKMYQKIKLMIKNLILPKSYNDEICYLSWYYSQKLPKKKLSTIVPIIVYKIILKYNIQSISLKDLKNSINFKYKTYFKNEKLFSELNEDLSQNNIINKMSHNFVNKNSIKAQKYSELVYISVTNSIKKIKEKSQTNLNIIKIKGKQRLKKNIKEKRDIGNNENENKNNKIIEKIIEKLTKEDNNTEELYSNPFFMELNNCQEQCKFFIYNYKEKSSNFELDTSFNNKIINLKEDESNMSNENQFNDYFKNKICCDILGLGMIKYFIDKNKIIVLSYKILKEIFNCNISQVKKSIFYIKLYINYINNN